MFDNIGDKIKTLASVITVLGIIASLITGGVMISANDNLALIGLLIMVLGSLISWISSFLLYGFGQLIENSDKLMKILSPDDAVQVPDTNDRLNTLNSWLRQGLISEEDYLKEVEATKNEK